MLKEELIRRALPALPATREEIVDIIDRKLYGTLPSPDFSLSAGEPTVAVWIGVAAVGIALAIVAYRKYTAFIKTEE